MTYFTPMTRVPAGLNVAPDVRLFGVERVQSGVPMTGSFLFELPKLSVPAIASPTGQGTIDLPNTFGARFVVKSELSGLEQEYTEPGFFPVRR